VNEFALIAEQQKGEEGKGGDRSGGGGREVGRPQNVLLPAVLVAD
jgi:hypothetical protein